MSYSFAMQSNIMKKIIEIIKIMINDLKSNRSLDK